MKLHTSVDTGMMSPEETTNSSSADVENVCKRIEEDFSYPAFEIIVLIQVRELHLHAYACEASP